MKRLILGILVVVGLLGATVAATEHRGDRLSPHTAAVAGGSELIVVPTPLGNKVQMLTVVDTRQRVICVYHIELATGKIALKSVRNIRWDLKINDLNNEKPLPQEIRSMSEQR